MAMDGQTAYMGASSGHTRGTNLLLLDGSVKLIVPTVDIKIWKEFARIGSEATRVNSGVLQSQHRPNWAIT